MTCFIVILYSICNFLALKFNLHIFQLNYYMADTQFKWMKKKFISFSIIFIINIIQIYLVYLNTNLSQVIIIILLILNIYLSIPKQVIKKLKFTNRIIRFYIVNYILLLIIFWLFKDNMKLFLSILFIINSLPTFYTILLNYINLPINNLINHYYINDARKILKNMPNLKIIAITGSYGKTSMKNYLSQLMSNQYNCLITPGNFNTLLGITKTIREHLKPTHEVFICEIGIDRVGQIDKIIKLLNPYHTIITAIGPQHLETFKTQENITNSKMKLAMSVKDGIAFLNLDNEYIANYNLDSKINIVGFGIKNHLNNKLEINNVIYSADGMKFDLKNDGQKYEVKSNLLGEHNLINLYGAITVANQMDVPIKTIINEIKHIDSVDHRLKLIPGETISIIDDSYNSNPIGAANALKVLKNFNGLKILITPGMVELGNTQNENNYNFGKLASECADYIFLINEKQTEYIRKGLIDSKFNEERIKIFNTFKGAMEEAKLLKSEKHKYVLIENDLPDNYK